MNVLDAIKDQTRPWVEADTAGDYRALSEGIAAMFQPLADLISDDDEGPGWSRLMDVARVPSRDLGYLAQFAGVTLLPGLSDADQRARIRSTDGQNRGTPGALVGAAQQYLTGDKRVVLRERFNPATGADAWHLQLFTRTAETADPAAIVRAVNAQKPAGLIIHFAVVDGADWEAVRTTYDSWLAVRDAYGDWTAVREATI